MARNRGYKKSPGPKKPPLTHFLCLPLITPESRPQLEKSMHAFRGAVVIKDSTVPSGAEQERLNEDDGDETTSSVHPKAIRPVGALHCTLGVMSLNDQKLKEAVDYLQELDINGLLNNPSTVAQTQSSIEPGSVNTKQKTESSMTRTISPPPTNRLSNPLKVNIRGLESMHAPTETSILYSAPSDPTERLYPFCLSIQKLFAEKGLLVPDDRKLKLHATIVNTIYAKGRRKKPSHRPGASSNGTPSVQQDDRAQGHGPDANAPLKMDATALLERFRDFVWAGGVVLDRIAICQMGAKKIMDAEGGVVGEEYYEVASVRLPT